MKFLFSFLCLVGLFHSGKYILTRVKFFHKIYMPAAVLSGLIGLILVQAVGAKAPAFLIADWSITPALLINVVFAALFLGFRLPSMTLPVIWQYSGPQLIYGQIVAWGQYAIGLGLSWFLLAPVFAVPPYFGIVMPLGFEGGHGSTAALKPVFNSLGWSAGADYSFAAATFGIFLGLVVGMGLINWAVWRGHTKILHKTGAREQANFQEMGDDLEKVTVDTKSLTLKNLSQNLGILAFCIAFGVVLKIGLTGLQNFIPALSTKNFLQSVPLMPFCILGAILVVAVLRKLQKNWIDHELMHTISGWALDFLIVAAIATIRVQNIIEGFWPFFILMAALVLWNVFCVMWLARRILPDAWFERSIVQLGQSLGVVVTGLLLLKIVDKDQKTNAAVAFGYKELVHEPLMGSGLWPFVAVPLAITQGPAVVFVISLVAIVTWLVVFRLTFFVDKNLETRGKK